MQINDSQLELPSGRLEVWQTALSKKKKMTSFMVVQDGTQTDT